MRISRFIPLAGVALFVWLLLSIDLPEVAATMGRISLPLFAAALLVTAVDIMIKAFKWKLLFASYGTPIPYTQLLSSWIIGLSLSLVTPGKIGDFAKAYYLKDRAPFGKSLTTVMADRIIDLITLFILAIGGMVIFAISYPLAATLPAVAAVFFALFLLAVLLFSKKSIASAILRPLYRRFAPAAYRDRLRVIYRDFYAGIGLILTRKLVVLAVTILTFGVWMGTALVIYVISLSLGIHIPYTFLLMVFPIITLLEALPISFAGVGTRDATLIFFFSFLSLAPEVAVSISLFYLLISYLFAAIGFWLWFKNPIRLSGS